jgi:hypothetical protein
MSSLLVSICYLITCMLMGTQQLHCQLLLRVKLPTHSCGHLFFLHLFPCNLCFCLCIHLTADWLGLGHTESLNHTSPVYMWCSAWGVTQFTKCRGGQVNWDQRSLHSSTLVAQHLVSFCWQWWSMIVQRETCAGESQLSFYWPVFIMSWNSRVLCMHIQEDFLLKSVWFTHCVPTFYTALIPYCKSTIIAIFDIVIIVVKMSYIFIALTCRWYKDGRFCVALWWMAILH